MTRIRGEALLALLIATGLLGACGKNHEKPGPGIANPASVYCVEQGGALEIERDQYGNERGICVLADGSRIDEWEYYRQSSQPTTTDDG